MNALITFPLRATIHVLWMDAAGVLPALNTNIPVPDIARWRRFSPAKLMELFRTIHLDRTILWADWAERPQDFRFMLPGIGEHVVLVMVEGEKGSPLPYAYSGVEKYRARDERRKREPVEDWDAGGVGGTYKGRIWDAVRDGRESCMPLPALSLEVVATCACGTRHTDAAFRDLELLAAPPERREGGTLIADVDRRCSCGRTVRVTHTRIWEGR